MASPRRQPSSQPQSQLGRVPPQPIHSGGEGGGRDGHSSLPGWRASAALLEDACAPLDMSVVVGASLLRPEVNPLAVSASPPLLSCCISYVRTYVRTYVVRTTDGHYAVRMFCVQCKGVWLIDCAVGPCVRNRQICMGHAPRSAYSVVGMSWICPREVSHRHEASSQAAAN